MYLRTKWVFFNYTSLNNLPGLLIKKEKRLVAPFLLLLTCLVAFMKTILNCEFKINVLSSFQLSRVALKSVQRAPMAHRQWSQEQYWFRKRLLILNFNYFLPDLMFRLYENVDNCYMNAKLRHLTLLNAPLSSGFIVSLASNYITLAPQSSSNLFSKLQFSKPKLLNLV